MPGIEDAHTIDGIGEDAKTGEAVLVMVETRPWKGSDARLFQLQEKINAYLSFALDGEMAESFPNLAGKTLRLQIDSPAMPDARTSDFLETIREQIAFQEIKLEVRVIPSPGE